MDYETGARLASLRKQNGYSQESLAEQLNISRQAVSKWERGESSPDTDNLILLASLYSMSLDELLGMGMQDGASQDEEKSSVSDSLPEETAPAQTKKRTKNKIVREKRVKEKKEKEIIPPLYPGLSGKLMKFPFIFIAAAVYVALGYYTKLWHPLWLITTLIPVYYWFVLACRAKTRRGFLLGLPVLPLTALAYVTIGFVTGAWTKPLLILMIIPIYYWIAAAFGKSHSK